MTDQSEQIPKPSIAARCCADELEALDMEQNPPWERQRWTPSYRAEVVAIIDRHSGATSDLLAALRGDDPEMLPSIQPLGWLYTAIQELKNPKDIQESYASDPDAWWMMINEIEWLYERGRAAIAKATGAP